MDGFVEAAFFYTPRFHKVAKQNLGFRISLKAEIWFMCMKIEQIHENHTCYGQWEISFWNERPFI